MPYTYSFLRRQAGVALEALADWMPRPPPASGPVRRILLVEPFQLGDVLSLSVMLDPLLRAWPEAEIHLLTQPKNAVAYARDPRVRAVHGVEFPWVGYGSKRSTMACWRNLARFLGDLDRDGGFDLGLDTRGDVRSQACLLRAGCRRRVGYTNYLGSNLRARGRLLTDNLGDLPVLHRYEYNLRVAAAVIPGGVPEGVRIPSLRFDGLAPVRLGPPGTRPVVVHPGGGWEFKRWAEERWVEVLRALVLRPDLAPVLVGGEGERALVERLAARVGAPPDRLPVRVTDWDTLVGLVLGADAFVGLDSGPLHLAHLSGIPVVGLFGPGDAAVWAPVGPRAEALLPGEGFPCAPCFQTRCVRPQDSCMGRITPAAVLAALDRVLAAPA